MQQLQAKPNDSLDYSKPKMKTVTFTIDTIQGVNCRGPNLRDRGNDANNEHPGPSRNTTNNLNCHDSLDYSKPETKTVTFTIDTIQGVNYRGPNLRDRGNDTNNEHPSPSRNTTNQSLNFNDSGNNSIPARTGKATVEITWKPRVLK